MSPSVITSGAFESEDKTGSRGCCMAVLSSCIIAQALMVISFKDRSNYEFLLVEPVVKTPYPPLGLMKISSMLRDRYKGCKVNNQVGTASVSRLGSPDKIFITSLFTWDWKLLVDTINFYKWTFPDSEIEVGGIAASLLADDVLSLTGVRPHAGLYKDAEFYPPDYSATFGRKNGASITFTTRGCVKKCKFCSVSDLEPDYFVKENWENDIVSEFPRVIFWDNNFLASPNFERDCERILAFGKKVDFNQGLDARLLDEERAGRLFLIDLNPIRFAFDDVSYEADVLRAIRLARKHSTKEIMVYVLYNFQDTPQNLYYRINLLNKEGVLSFPMEYRSPTRSVSKLPGPHWNTFLLRAFKLTLLFYYRKGMITKSRDSFLSIYGRSEQEFVSRLYEIYSYDKSLKRVNKNDSPFEGGTRDG